VHGHPFYVIGRKDGTTSWFCFFPLKKTSLTMLLTCTSHPQGGLRRDLELLLDYNERMRLRRVAGIGLEAWFLPLSDVGYYSRIYYRTGRFYGWIEGNNLRTTPAPKSSLIAVARATVGFRCH
jgi:hypothetical protein